MSIRTRALLGAVLAAVAVVATACPPPPPPSGTDTTPPVLSLPDDLTVPADDPSGAEVTWDATATDDTDGDVPVTCSPEPGFFAVGDTEVTCTAADAAGNEASGSFTVTVTAGDFDAPLLSLPAGITEAATSAAGAEVTWSATAVDAADGDVAVDCAPPPGQFPLGDTEVTCTAIDAAGNEATGSFTVTVADLTPPALTLPADILTPATTTTGAPVTWTATALDAVDGDVAVDCTPTPVEFPIGDTLVTCTAVDAAGNEATGTFTVTVEFTDLTPPVLTLPADITEPAVDANGAPVTWAATALDDVDGDVPVDCTPVPGTFPLGQTEVTCIAVDAAGNESTGSFTVTVADLTPPVLTLPAGITVTADDADGAEIDWEATAEDNVDGTVAVNCTHTPGVFAIGNTEVTCTAVDAAGNDAIGSFTVVVENRAIQISAGELHTCALMIDRTVRCWGQLGVGTPANSSVPVPIAGLTDAVAIDAGSGYTCAVLSNGTARCWGYNHFGQLGDGTYTHSSVPVTVTGLTDITDISASSTHTCAALNDGTARCWGHNLFGRLGDGTNTASSVPVAVTGLSGVTDISAGYDHTCAALSDGTARCWGDNGLGQLGDGTNTNSPVPVAVTGLSSVTDISAGNNHTCAALSDGTARCWGDDEFGRLGDGNPPYPETVPVPVVDLTDATGISSGWDHTCAALSDGTARCWGANGWGKLGNPTFSMSNRPVIVADLTGASAISADRHHSCALAGDAAAYCWGRNGQGQLGDGTTGNSSVPVTVVGLT